MGIFLCQRKYALESILKVGLSGARPASTPVEPNHHLAKTVDLTFVFPDRYWRFIGKLIYLALTRLELAYVVHELAYVVHILAQFMQAPQQQHCDAAFCMLCYLKRRPD